MSKDAPDHNPSVLMRKAKVLFFAILVGVISAAAEARVFARENIRVAYPSVATSFLPLWVARDIGFFQKNNTSIELVSIASSSTAMASLLAGDIDVIIGGANPGIAVQLQGHQDMALFGGLADTFLFSIFSQAAITGVAQLKGKRMGVTRFGGSNDFAGRYFLRTNGLEPNKDLTLIQVGRQNDILGALLGGSIHAGVLGYPSVLLAKKQGLYELADLSQSGPQYQLVAFVAKRSFLKAHRAAMEGFIKAIVESVHYLKTHRVEGIKMLGRYTRISDQALLASLYGVHVQRVFPRVPKITPKSIALILEHLSEEIPGAKSAKPEQFIEDEIVESVIRSGLVERLYR
jgi:ABC-type nitrate/sulfonate/bicarbonate transport system substrate-binding protein